MANLTTGNWTATAGTNTCNGAALTTNTTDYTIPSGVTVTLVAANTVVARSLTIASGGRIIFAATTSIINMGDTASGTGGAGNVALSVSSGATVTLTGIGTINFVTTSGSQQTVTCGGKTLPNLTFNSSPGTSYLLGDPLISSGTITHSAATFATGNYAITASSFSANSATNRTLTLGSSIITLSSTGTSFQARSSGLTVTANTATITCAGNGTTLSLSGSGGGAAIDWNGASFSFTGSGTKTISFITGSSVKDLTITGSTTKTDIVSFAALTLNVNGTFTVTGNSTTNRVLVQSGTIGTSTTIIAGTNSLTNVDFMDLTFITAGTVLVSDSFNRSNGSLGTSDSAAGGTNQTWGTATGTWAISSNAVVAAATGGSIGLPVGISDMRVSAKLAVNSPNSGESTIIMARYTDWSNALQLFCAQSGTITLYSRVGGSYTNVATMSGTFAAGDTVSLQVVGLVYTVLVNGVIVGTGTVPSTVLNTVTSAGIGFNGSGGASVRIDDFKVEQIGAIGTSIGDCLGNTNLTADTPTTRYGVVAGNWSNTAIWSTTSGGTGGASVPLPQDNVVLDSSSGAGTYTADMPRICADFTCTAFTRTVSTGIAFSMYGSLTIGSGTTWTQGAFTCTFAGRGSHSITTNGNTLGGTIFNAVGGTYSLQDTWISNAAIQHNYGTLTTNSYNITALNFYSTLSGSSPVRAFNGGTSIMTITGGFNGTAVTLAGNGLTWNGAGVSFVLSGVSPLTRIFNGNGNTFAALQYDVANSSGQLTLVGNNTFGKVQFGPGRTIANTAGAIQTVLDGAGSTIGGTYNGFVYLSGTTSNYISTPDSAALSMTGDFTLLARVAMDDWTPTATSAIIGKYTVAGQRSYLFDILLTTGNLRLILSSNGTSTSLASSSVSPVISDGSTLWVLVSWRASDGRTQFFTADGSLSNPAASDFTQLGTNQTIAVGSIFDGTQILEIGSYNVGTNENSAGDFYRAKIYNGLFSTSAFGGTLQFDADFTTKTVGANTFTESSANAATVTITGATAQAGDGRLALTSTTAVQTFWQMFGAPAIMDYLMISNVYSSTSYKFYAGINSVNGGNNTNIIFTALPAQPYMAFDADSIVTTATSGTATFLGSHYATAGNLLLFAVTCAGNPGTVTTPAGWTFIDASHGTAGYTYVYSKIAIGTENTVTISWSSSSANQVRMVEIAGWLGVPTLDVKDKNNSISTNVNNLSTGSGVTNSTALGYAFALFGSNSTQGATVSASNSFQPSRGQSADATTYMKIAAKPLLATGSQSTTYVWTSARVSASQLVVFMDVYVAGIAYRMLLGVGS